MKDLVIGLLLLEASVHELFHGKMRGVFSRLSKFLSNELFVKVLKKTIIIKGVGF
jgi:hypothetical protein